MRRAREVIDEKWPRPNVGAGSPSRRPRVPAALDGDTYSVVDVDVGRLWIARDDGVMRPFMEKSGSWELDEGVVLRSLVRPGCRFLDVGANIGYFSVLAFKAAAAVVVDAVEPDPVNATALQMNLWAHQVAGTVWQLALDDHERVLVLNRSRNNRGDSRTSKVEASRSVPDAAIIVPAAPGDRLFESRTFDVVKIDVQGWELEVLTGLNATLRRNLGARIIAEFWPSALIERDRDPRETLSLYHQMGYEMHTLVGTGVQKLTDAAIMEMCASAGHWGQVNLLLSRSRL